MDLAGDLAQLRGVNRIEKVATALVVSNSCDNDGGDPIILAPVRPYEFADGGDLSSGAMERHLGGSDWNGQPKLFYLAGSAKFNISRSEAQLGDLFVLEQSFIDLCIQCGMARVCGLTPATVRHLQWHLSTVFSRNPRDDGAWPSDDDKRLKLEWLEKELERGSKRYDLYRKERDELRAYLGVTALSPTGALVGEENATHTPLPNVEPTK